MVRLLAIASLVILAACTAKVTVGAKVVDQATVESQVASELAAQLNQPVPTVTCPGDLDAKLGATMDCTLTPQGGGSTLPVHVTVDSLSNGTAHFSAQVGQIEGQGNKTKFCDDNATLDQATAGAQQPSDLVPIFKTNQSTIEDFKANAPQNIIADAATVANAALAAISSGDASAFATQPVMAAGQAVDAYCGQNSDGTPATTSTTA